MIAFRSVRGLLILAAGVTLGACRSNPAQPSAVVGVPTPLVPSNSAQIAFTSQPVALVVANAAISGATPTYTFEVAADSVFANRVQTKSVAQSASGQTSVVLDLLETGKDYYWHVRAQSGSTMGAFSNALKFTVLAFSTPTPISPPNGSVVSNWPTLVVGNAQRSGQTVSPVYRFDISTTSTFDAILETASVPEGSGQTSFTPTSALPAGQTTMFWRASAADQSSGLSGPASGTQNFALRPSQSARIAAEQGIILWPGAHPPGTPGQALMGDNWNVQTVASFHGVVHVTPTLDELRVFDVIDHGFDAQAAVNWIIQNGYETAAVWYPNVQVVGFLYEYMAYINGQWKLVFRLE